MKCCRICGFNKDLEDFPKRKYKGVLTHRNECSFCISEFQKKYREENKQKIAQSKKDWAAKNKEQKRKINYEWWMSNKEKAKVSCSNHRLRNPEIYRMKRAERRARERMASFLVYRSQVYQIYKNCPEGYEVDHIIPLNNPDICGLHVPWNLQYLTIQENRKKSNKI